MTTIDYFSIPTWLKESALVKEMFDSAIANRDFETISQPFEVKFFVENPSISSFEDFVLVLNTATYFDAPYPISLFWFVRNNKEEALNYLTECEFHQEVFDKLSGDSWIFEDGRKDEMVNYLKSMNEDKTLIKDLESTLNYKFKIVGGRLVDFFLGDVQIGEFDFSIHEHRVLHDAIRDNDEIDDDPHQSVIWYSKGFVVLRMSVYDNEIEDDLESCGLCLRVTQFNKQAFLDFFINI